MNKLLEGRIAFVTGGAGGIGAATAIAFAEEGAKVAVSDLKGAADTVATIVAAGGEAYAITLDVTDQAAVTAAVDGVVAKWGRLDIAFNNAGVSLEDMTTPWESVDVYEKVVAVNQRGVMLCMAAELKHMAPQKSGAIVNTASVAGLTGLAGAGYCSSKHAVVGLTRSAAMRYAAEGIRVNCVCPGAISTPMTESDSLDPQSKAFMAQMHPMNRMGEAREIADGVVFLVSDKASFITGHPLAIDGGYVAR
ncbi:SDR family oxidoreductase [Sphingomonas paeninsulae]|jgi:NAD(P)-dependent dehydrogenase (short-subunit alcohol dehydrogenase family)|uniref:SDR family oxidoreductase n=1 Tax=Sphingomonas paeninsulae TaxID=2319844 RepID=A0A494TC99_SPHPE|nr:SDR family oxidoreductase [Sphingomonas paeninsulae]AYJ87067.1 SDR family oxidoreductase [Sphingomonas paeninsulae]